MGRVKQTIAKQCAGRVPMIKRMRIREFTNNKLTRLYLNERTLGKNVGSSLRDYTQICIQRKWRKDEQQVTKNHILLNCVRWDRKSLSLGAMIEFVFLKKTKILTDLKHELSEISGIDRDKLAYTLAYGYEIEQYKQMHNTKHPQKGMKMGHQLNDKSTLVSWPWKCRQGDVIL